jgi:hypothetical protein
MEQCALTPASLPFSGDIRYARARDGARVFFRLVGDTIEILAKASKQNEPEVIRALEKLYK